MSQRLLSDFARTLIDDVRAQMRGKDANATGKTSESLNYFATDSRLLVNGSKAFVFIEKGRAPGKRPPVKNIEEWVVARGIATGRQAWGIAFAISKKIGESGTVLFRKQSFRDIYTGILNDGRLETLLESVNSEALRIVEFDVFEVLNKKAA